MDIARAAPPETERPVTVDPKLPFDTGTVPPPAQKAGTTLLDPPAADAPQPQQPPQTALQLWLPPQLGFFFFVLISAVAGVLLVILPWTPEWTDNYLSALVSTSLRTFVSTGFFRGLCSGLGLLDIWIGFWEALHYHEHQ